MKQPMSPDLKGPMSKAVSTPLTAGVTVGTSPGGVGVDQAVQEARWDLFEQVFQLQSTAL